MVLSSSKRKENAFIFLNFWKKQKIREEEIDKREEEEEETKSRTSRLLLSIQDLQPVNFQNQPCI